MRIAAIVAGAALVLLLGAMQILGSVAVRGTAQPGAWVRFVPERFARRVDALDTDLPLPPALRLVLARHALDRGDLALAARDVARMAPSRDRFVLAGDLAEARHDTAAAVAAYMAAGDLAGVQTAVDAQTARGNVAGALELERAAIARLRDDRTQADALAEAYFHLGLLQETQAYAYPVGTPERHANELLAVGAYARASALAPLSLRYLIALGNQQLNLNAIAAAQHSFAHARDVDPTSAEPLVGLADAALRGGDLAAARAYYERARALDPASQSVRRLASRLAP